MKKNSDRVASNQTKHLLVENELKKLKTFDLSYFKGKSYFDSDDDTQYYLVFQAIEKYLKTHVTRIINEPFASFTHISEWKSKGLFDESIKCPTASNGDK